MNITIVAEVITGITIPLVQIVMKTIGESINTSKRVPKEHSKRLDKTTVILNSLALARMPTIKQKNQESIERLTHHMISVRNFDIKSADFDTGIVKIVFSVFSVYSLPNK